MKTKLFYLILLILAFACKDNKNTIRIATKPMTEQFILGEMLCALIEDNTDYQVNITKGIGGGTSNIHPAIVKGEFDLYPEYTGTGWLVVLKKDSFPSSENLYNELQKEYLEKYGLHWIAPYGFNNAYSLAVNKQIATNINYINFRTYPSIRIVLS